MQRYRKRPQVVEAEQWFPGKVVDGVVEQDRHVGGSYVHAWIEGRDGLHAVYQGDWIVVDHRGERYPIRQRSFEADYEPIDTTDDIETIAVHDFGIESIEVGPDDIVPQDIAKVETEILFKTKDK